MFGRDRNRKGFSPLLTGMATSVLQGYVARKLATRVGGRALGIGGGLPGLLVGMGATYLVNRYLDKRRQQQGNPATDRR